MARAVQGHPIHTQETVPHFQGTLSAGEQRRRNREGGRGGGERDGRREKDIVRGSGGGRRERCTDRQTVADYSMHSRSCTAGQ